MFSNNDVTCISPWYEIRIDTDGSLRCCHAFRLVSREKTDLSFIEWFNKGNLVSTVRDNIKNGLPSPSCDNCYKNEELNLISFRERRNLQAAIYHNEHFYESLVQSPVYDRLQGNVTNFKPAFIHVSLSNLCNSSCRMCFPVFSSRLAADLKKIDILPQDHKIYESWSDNEKKWNDFLDLVKDNDGLLSLHFMGGEPLLHKRFVEFVDWAIKNNQTNYYLTFVTNGTIYDEELFNKLQKFKKVVVELSIESLGKTNDYIRLGSTHSQVLANYYNYKNHVGSNLTIVLRTVPQALSIKEYDSIIDFALQNDLPIDNNFLNGPSFLKVNVLPKEVKDSIFQKISVKYVDILNSTSVNQEVAVIHHPGLERMKTHIKSILKLLQEEEPENIEELRAKFIQHNKNMDKISELKFDEVYPELVSFYEKYNQN